MRISDWSSDVCSSDLTLWREVVARAHILPRRSRAKAIGRGVTPAPAALEIVGGQRVDAKDEQAPAHQRARPGDGGGIEAGRRRRIGEQALGQSLQPRGDRKSTRLNASP